MKLQIVVSCRMPHAGLVEGSPGGGYLARARALTTRAEAHGATLAAWSATTLAFAWDLESLEEAVALATTLDEAGGTAALAPEVAWGCGIAEGLLEPLGAKGQRAELAWGPALVTAVSLARIAEPGEVLVDGDVGALRASELHVVGTRASTDKGKRVRGWKLDKARPWRPYAPRASYPGLPVEEVDIDVDRTVYTRVPEVRPSDPPRDEVPEPRGQHPSVLDLIQSVDDALASSEPSLDSTRPGAGARSLRDPLGPEADESPPPRASAAAVASAALLEARIRSLAHTERASGPDALLALRRARVNLEGASASARCQASLALAIALGMAGRAEEALLEGLDALARAREDPDPKAIQACLAFLAKLYAGVSHHEEAARLRALG